jgi:uncharacterized protein
MSSNAITLSLITKTMIRGLVIWQLISAAVMADDRGLVNTSRSPYAKLRSVDLADVKFTDGFWKEKWDLVKDVTIPEMWKYFDSPQSEHWRNFRRAAGLDKSEWKGSFWGDGDFYKWLESVAIVYSATRDSALDKQMDEIIAVIGKAQAPDGYISTRVLVQKELRFQYLIRHELYNMGHLMTAACIHNRATGKTNFLDIARKTGDYLYETFKDRKPELAHFCFNPSNIMGAVELYRTTKDRKYLDLANIFIDMRGSQPGKQNKTGGGTDQTQDRVPLRKETQAVGHAVTAAYLYSGAADAYMESGDKSLLDALDCIWRDVVERKIYIHGGIGPLTRGMSPRYDDVHEAFGDAFFLPNRKCYCETCANIGNAMWNWRMLAINCDARHTDIIERVFYNSGLAPLALDGDHFFYTNVLRRLDASAGLLRSDTPQRWKHRGGYCCPPQVARTIAEISTYFYSISDNALWVHLYGANQLDTSLSDGSKVKVTQETNYPWDGDVTIKLDFPGSKADDLIELDVPTTKDISLNLRIPEWAEGAKVQVNGQAVSESIKANEYLKLKRPWQPGDVVKLLLPMDVRMIVANPLVEELRGQVAVMRGPMLYCLESVDLPEGISVMDVILPHEIKLAPRFDAKLLGGVTVLEGEALVRHDPDWSAYPYGSPVLYKNLSSAPPESVKITLIPYYAWCNRGASQMTVWCPLR